MNRKVFLQKILLFGSFYRFARVKNLSEDRKFDELEILSCPLAGYRFKEFIPLVLRITFFIVLKLRSG